MADIATLGVIVKTSGVREAERDLTGLTKEGARAEAQADKIGAAWGKRLGVAVLAGTAVLAAGVAKVVQNTIAAEKVQAQLAARIRSTGGAAGLAVADLNKMADALQAATTFDDEAIGGAQAVLLTFTKIGKDVFPSATEAVLNLSTAFGTDLNGAALQVGKALNDPIKGITALARAGVQFTDDQKALIASLVETGQQAEAQRIILAELETQIGGSARAARDTLGGALQALSNAFDNALEGDSGSDGARGLTRAVNDLTDTLNSAETREGFETLTSGLLSVANTAAQVITLLAGVAKAVPNAFKGVGELDRDGLIDRQLNLEDRIKSASKRGPLITGFLPAQRENVEELQKELAEVLRLQDEITRSGNARQIALDSGGAGGSPNGRGRGVRGAPGIADQGASEKSQQLIDKINEEAAAYGLSRAALLERDKAKAVAAATSEKERVALTASYDALIAKVGADERSTGASAGAAAATRDAAAAERERQAVVRDGQLALEDLTGIVRQNAADLAGPAAQAAKVYADELLNLVVVEQQLRAANLLTAESENLLKIARDQADEGFQRRIDSINEQKTAAEQLIADLQFENSLLGLGNLARQQEIALRYAGADATEEQKKQIRELIAEQERAAQVAEALDVVRDSTQGLFRDLIDGSKSAKDAFKDFVDNILDGIGQIVARNLTESLFGSSGSTGGGFFGDGLGSLFSSFLGGGPAGRAIGGPISKGNLYQVGEKGQPELLNIYGKQYLIPGANGSVTPASAGGNDRGGDVYQTIQVTGTISRKSAYQLEREASMQISKAGGR